MIIIRHDPNCNQSREMLPETLLPSSVPDLQLDRFPSDVNHSGTKLHTDGVIGVLFNCNTERQGNGGNRKKYPAQSSHFTDQQVIIIMATTLSHVIPVIQLDQIGSHTGHPCPFLLSLCECMCLSLYFTQEIKERKNFFYNPICFFYSWFHPLFIFTMQTTL